jgi:predicted nuclease of predicted toxin-antitoxin system
MKFLIDEQLPNLLVEWLLSKGYDTVHASALLTNTRIPDEYICECSMAEERIVITKDADFLNTYLVKQQPYKLVYITTGNLRNRPLMDLFRASLSQLIQELETASVIELNQSLMRVWF